MKNLSSGIELLKSSVFKNNKNMPENEFEINHIKCVNVYIWMCVSLIYVFKSTNIYMHIHTYIYTYTRRLHTHIYPLCWA